MDERLRERRLLERASFGPRPGEAEAVRQQGARGWLERQLASSGPYDPALESRLAAFPSLSATSPQPLEGMEMAAERGRGRLDSEQRKELKRRARAISREVAGSRVVRAVHGEFGLREVMVDFWSNHFSVFARKNMIGVLLPHYQRQVIEPHALGRFEDLLFAVARSPAMLVYLDNWRSTRKDLPPRARRSLRGAGGINENYARELLELHTLGVHGGYEQQDIVEVARVLTGWTLESRRNPVFRYRDALHDPGPKRVLGRRVPGDGELEGEWLLRHLAGHPSTARHIASRLASRLVADVPPASLVERAARRFLATGGEMREVLREILLSPDFAEPAHQKLKTPLRLVASALRTTGGQTDGGNRMLLALLRLGEMPYQARTPAGYPDEASHWVDPGAMLERMGFAFALARGRLRGTRAGTSLPEGFAPMPRGSQQAALALALASPEFQWA